MASERLPRSFAHAGFEAAELLNDRKKTEVLIRDALNKADRYKSSLLDIWDDLLTLIKLVKAWKSGRYRSIPYKTIVLGVTAIFYFLNPFDVIPDILPALGFVDDAAVIAFVLNSTREDIARFRAWQEENGRLRTDKNVDTLK